MAFGFFDRIKDGLEKTRKSFVKNVESICLQVTLGLRLQST